METPSGACLPARAPPLSMVDGRAGKAAYEYIEKAIQLAMKGALDTVATAPLNKEALSTRGCYH